MTLTQQELTRFELDRRWNIILALLQHIKHIEDHDLVTYDQCPECSDFDKWVATEIVGG